MTNEEFKMEKPNLTYVHSMSGKDIEFEKNLIQIIKTELIEEVKIYTENINSKNYKLSANNVHKLKHKIGILGLEQGYELAIEFEKNLLDGKTILRDEFESVLSAMTKFLNKL